MCRHNFNIGRCHRRWCVEPRIRRDRNCVADRHGVGTICRYGYYFLYAQWLRGYSSLHSICHTCDYNGRKNYVCRCQYNTQQHSNRRSVGRAPILQLPLWVLTGSPSTGTVSGVAAGTATISYSLGSCYAVATVTVNPLPDAGSISGLSLICTGSYITLTDAAGGGAWSASNAHVSIVGSAGSPSTGIANGNTAGTDTISYTVTNSCGTAVATKTVTVNAVPTAGTITGSATVCAGATINLSDAVTGGNWTPATGGIATVSPMGTVTGASAGSVIISYTVTYSCGTATATSIIGVSAAPAAGTITGASSVCQGAIMGLTDGATGGTWSAANTNASISSTGVVAGATAGTDTIYYTVTNSCGTATASKVIAINALPEPGIISGPSTVCLGQSIPLSETVTGTWSAASAWIATVSAAGVVTAMSLGTDTIIYTATNPCGSAITTKTIVVNPLPPPITASAPFVCSGFTTVVSDTLAGGLWSASPDSIATISASGIVSGAGVVQLWLLTHCRQQVAIVQPRYR